MAPSPREQALRAWLRRKAGQHRSQLGVSFRDLGVHGFFSSASSFQHTVVSYALALPRFVADRLSDRQPKKVPILHNLNGLVYDGEMLLVLGRPGSGCSTFLKALAGDTHGIYIDDTQAVNYQGKNPHPTMYPAANFMLLRRP